MDNNSQPPTSFTDKILQYVIPAILGASSAWAALSNRWVRKDKLNSTDKRDAAVAFSTRLTSVEDRNDRLWTQNAGLIEKLAIAEAALKIAERQIDDLKQDLQYFRDNASS